jgi:indole-3-glycerol phosphate synthase
MTAPAATYLDRILDAHRSAAARDQRSVDALTEEAKAQPAARGFAAALRAVSGTAVIAEIKRRSPAKGDIRADLDPAELARSYETGGATCLSVLTDSEFFGGSAGDLRAARAATSLPVLRKDFTLSAADVCDARLMGADAVLLIVAALDDAELRRLHKLAVEVGLDVLVEVHDEPELECALAAGATLVGVNQRDLFSFSVDRERAMRMALAMPPGVTRVAESGIRGVDDVGALRIAGFDAVLVGEALVVAGDPEAAVRSLRDAGDIRTLGEMFRAQVKSLGNRSSE